MSLEAKIIFTACVLAFVLPMMVMVLRRIISGKPFKKPGMGGMPLPPPSGPSIDGGT